MTRTLAAAACAAVLFAAFPLPPTAPPALAESPVVAAPFMAPVPTACATTTCPAKGAGAGSPAPASPAPEVVIGNAYPGAHLVTEPGRYGLSEARPGEVYAVVKHTLVRLDRKTFKALSVLRQIEGPRD